MVTEQQLQAIMPAASKARVARFVAPLNDTMTAFGITTPARQAAFLAQLAHESGSLRYVEEIASGKAYDDRADLGNTSPAAIALAELAGTTPGQHFKGRGLIQITGYANYAACSKALLGNAALLTAPEKLQQDDLACKSAGWYWDSRHLNGLADEGQFEAITRKINGGLNGQADRLAFYNRALAVLHLPAEPQTALSAGEKVSMLPTALRVLSAGEELTNAATWKNRAALASALTVVVLGIAEVARMKGYALPFTNDQLATGVGTIVVLLFNIWTTYATSRRVGLSSGTASVGTAASDSGGERVLAPEPALPKPTTPAGNEVQVLDWLSKNAS